MRNSAKPRLGEVSPGSRWAAPNSSGEPGGVGGPNLFTNPPVPTGTGQRGPGAPLNVRKGCERRPAVGCRSPESWGLGHRGPRSPVLGGDEPRCRRGSQPGRFALPAAGESSPCEGRSSRRHHRRGGPNPRVRNVGAPSWSPGRDQVEPRSGGGDRSHQDRAAGAHGAVHGQPGDRLGRTAGRGSSEQRAGPGPDRGAPPPRLLTEGPGRRRPARYAGARRRCQLGG